MATSVGRLLADAIVAELNSNARSWFEKFTAARLWRTDFPMEDLANLTVTVFPFTKEPINLTDTKGTTRAKRRYEYRIIVDFQQQVDGADTEKVDALVDLIDADITGFYADLHYLAPAGLPANVWYVSEVALVDNALYSFERLFEQAIFEAALELTVIGFA